MRVWRVCKAQHVAAAFTGDGSMLYAGRWHPRGTRVVYASESRALAALEQLVHLHRNRLPPNFVCFAVDIPSALDLIEVRVQDLPEEWRRYPGPAALQEIGARWLREFETACLRVPSAVVPGESNFLLNPLHEDFTRLIVGEPESFELDPRLLGE